MGYEKCRGKESECSGNDVFEKYGRSVTNGKSYMNYEVCRRAGIERELVNRADQRVLR